MINVRWPDGSLTCGSSYQAILEKLMNVQSRKYSVVGMKHELARRAWVWGGYRVRWWRSLEVFFRDLEVAKMVVITTEGHANDEEKETGCDK